MFTKSCLAAVSGIMLFAVSAAVPTIAFAAAAEFITESANPLDTASVNIEQQQFAQRGRRGGGRGGGGKAKPERAPSASPGSPGAGPGGPGSPGAGPGGPGSPGAGPGGPGSPGGNVNVNRNVNVTVKRRGPGWRGTRWGAVVFGVTLGTAIIVAANTPPPPPDPSLCWTWTNADQTSGYWYYCTGS